MTRKIRFNVAGDPHGDQPTVEPLDGKPAIACHFESAGRLVTDNIPADATGGADVFYQRRQKTFRVILPPLGGDFELEAGDPLCLPPEYHGDVDKVALHYGPATSDQIQIVDDHFEVNGKRWLVRGLDGFSDLAILLDGGDIRPMLRQSQDLGVRVRRVFGAMKNIRDFNPDRYPNYHDGIRALCALYAEFGIYADFDVLPDCELLGWSLSRCQRQWVEVCATFAPITNKFNVSLTNEYDHGGNLVGRPRNATDGIDYSPAPFALCSAGSAVSDAPPWRPGWGIREFHCLKDWPKIFLCEDMLFNREGVDADGHTWGPRKPTYLSETFRFDESNPYTDERLARTLALESSAFGEGLVMHCEDAKWGRVLGPRQASCVKTAMDCLIKVEG